MADFWAQKHLKLRIVTIAVEHASLKANILNHTLISIISGLKCGDITRIIDEHKMPSFLHDTEHPNVLQQRKTAHPMHDANMHEQIVTNEWT